MTKTETQHEIEMLIKENSSDLLKLGFTTSSGTAGYRPCRYHSAVIIDAFRSNNLRDLPDLRFNPDLGFKIHAARVLEIPYSGGGFPNDEEFWKATQEGYYNSHTGNGVDIKPVFPVGKGRIHYFCDTPYDRPNQKAICQILEQQVSFIEMLEAERDGNHFAPFALHGEQTFLEKIKSRFALRFEFFQGSEEFHAQTDRIEPDTEEMILEFMKTVLGYADEKKFDKKKLFPVLMSLCEGKNIEYRSTYGLKGKLWMAKGILRQLRGKK